MADFDPTTERFVESATIFEITSTPAGEAPEAIREQWIGARLPVHPDMLSQLGAPSTANEFITGAQVRIEQTVPVRKVDAIRALEHMGRPEAAEFWRNLHRAGGTLIFDANEGRIVRTIAQMNEDWPDLA